LATFATHDCSVAAEVRRDETPSACASRMSAGNSGSMAMQPDTWKPPMPNREACGDEWPGEIDRARELVRLHAH